MYENRTEDIIKAQQDDQEKMAELIEKNSGLIWSIVKRFIGRGHELEDLYQIGTMGFIKAIKRFNAEYEVQLSTYAVPYILGEIKRFIRDDGMIKVSRSMKELGIKIKEIQKAYFNQYGEDITVNQIAETLKITKEEVATVLDSMNPIESIYAENQSKDGKACLLDKLSDQEDEAEKIVNKISIKELIQSLDEKEKEIILLRYYKQKTQMQVANILGISQVQVSRIEKRVLNSMRNKLIS